ncbi:MAG: hypothetical protein ABIR47_13275 [Candidatus Kapaibacterium sp.]
MMATLGKYTGTALLLLLLVTGSTTAQVADSKGKEFWVAFMTNISHKTAEAMTMELYLASSKPTTVTLTYMETGASRTVNLPTPNVTVTVDIGRMFGYDVELPDLGRSTINELTLKSIHVVANEEITLYGSSIKAFSADAFLGLPADVLRGRYIVLGYHNGIRSSFPTTPFEHPSEFAVIGTRDGTTVQVKPSPGLRINGRGNAPFTVMLDQGEVFFAQAGLESEQDVSGTEIQADKPVALFAGSARVCIPTYLGTNLDNVFEQIPPSEVWGKNALVAPYFPVSSNEPSLVHVLAAFNGTNLQVVGSGTGTRNFTIGAGSVLELPLSEAMSFTATQPILVAQYEHSAPDNGNFNDHPIGDPFMMLIPPVEQFDTAYAFQSIVNSEFPAEYHYINVVIPANGVGSLRLDGIAVSATFRPVPGSSFKYAQIQLQPGNHFVKADSAFGLYVYGYGHANSYGYPGGLLFRRLVIDYTPPTIIWSDSCASGDGVISDNGISDSGIDSVEVTKDTVNVRVTVDPIARGSDTLRYHAVLIDPYQDGVISMRCTDSAGLTTLRNFKIPGFTVRVAGGGASPIIVDTLVRFNDSGICRRVMIENYGGFDQTVARAWLVDSNSRATITTMLPITLAPGGSAAIDICFPDAHDTTLLATLAIAGACTDRTLATIPVDHRTDTSAPGSLREQGSCNGDLNLSYFEGYRESGIMSAAVDLLINGSSEWLTDSTQLPTKLVKLRLHKVDPRQDMIYQITLRDSLGNTTLDRDTIGGFTLAVLGRSPGDTLSTPHGGTWEGDSLNFSDIHCDSITLANYGLKPLHVSRVMMAGNLSYSIPPSQLPLVIPSKSAMKIAVCLVAGNIGTQYDTMLVFDDCESVEKLPITASVSSLELHGSNNCHGTISVQTLGPAKRTFLTDPMPNPVAGNVSLDVGLMRDEQVRLEVFDANGEQKLTVIPGVAMKGGLSRVSFDIGSLENGAYFCRLLTTRGEMKVAKMIVRR